MIRLVPAVYWPTEWFIVFRRTSTLPWLNRLPFMRYRHVLCFGKVAAAGVWVFHDFGLTGTTVATVPDREADRWMEQAIAGARVLCWKPEKPPAGLRLKPWFVCTTAVAHLTGIPSCALRPDRFLRDCIAAGATAIAEDDEPVTENRAGPDAGRGTSSGEEREDRRDPKPRLVAD